MRRITRWKALLTAVALVVAGLGIGWLVGHVSVEAQSELRLEATGAFEARGSAGASIEGCPQVRVTGAMVSVNGSAMTEIKGGLVKIN